MTDEEKHAIEIVKGITEDDLLNYWEGPEEPYNAIQTVLNIIEKQSKEIEELKANKGYHLGFIDGGIAKRYEYEDKIKAKIEEVEQWELYNMKIPKLSTLEERLGAKIGINYVLQSLLEKE